MAIIRNRPLSIDCWVKIRNIIKCNMEDGSIIYYSKYLDFHIKCIGWSFPSDLWFSYLQIILSHILKIAYTSILNISHSQIEIPSFWAVQLKMIHPFVYKDENVSLTLTKKQQKKQSLFILRLTQQYFSMEDIFFLIGYKHID